MNQRGIADLVIAGVAFGVFVLVMAIGNGIQWLMADPPCAPPKQCIDYGSGTVEAPKGAP